MYKANKKLASALVAGAMSVTGAAQAADIVIGVPNWPSTVRSPDPYHQRDCRCSNSCRVATARKQTTPSRAMERGRGTAASGSATRATS